MLQWCRLFKWCRNLPSGHCVTVVKTVLAVSEPTCRALCYSGEGCLSGVRTYLPGTVLQWCRLFKRCWNLSAKHCDTVVKAVLALSEPTCRALCCRLFKQCQNLPAGHCVTVVKAVLAMSEPTYQARRYSGKGCFSNVGVYLLGTVLQWCRLFKQCQNLPAGHCVTVVKGVLAMSEPTCQALCYSDAGCLSGVGVYLPGTVFQWCRFFKPCQNLPAGHSVTVVQAA